MTLEIPLRYDNKRAYIEEDRIRVYTERLPLLQAWNFSNSVPTAAISPYGSLDSWETVNDMVDGFADTVFHARPDSLDYRFAQPSVMW